MLLLHVHMPVPQGPYCCLGTGCVFVGERDLKILLPCSPIILLIMLSLSANPVFAQAQAQQQGTSIVNDELLDPEDRNNLGVPPSPYIDLARVKVSQISSSELELRIEVDGGIPESFEDRHDVKYIWDLDTDRNRMTSIWPISEDYPIGPDVIISIRYDVPSKVWRATIWFGGEESTELSRQSFIASGNAIVATFTLAQLGNPSSFNWIVGSMEAWLDSNGYVRKDKPFWVDLAPSKGYGTLTISSSIQTTVSFTFRVYDWYSDSPVVGASVWFDGSYLGVTDSNGWIAISAAFPPADHSYRISSGGYDGESGSVTIGSNSGGFFVFKLKRSASQQTTQEAAPMSPSVWIPLGMGTGVLAAVLAMLLLTRRKKPAPRSAPKPVVPISSRTASPLKPVPQVQEEDPRYVEYLARLEELRTRGEISEQTYQKLKDEYWKRIGEDSG